VPLFGGQGRKGIRKGDRATKGELWKVTTTEKSIREVRSASDKKSAGTDLSGGKRKRRGTRGVKEKILWSEDPYFLGPIFQCIMFYIGRAETQGQT